jgi:CelD/BcsL family acetyltransferase involved in cellulose biosynthesis
MHIELVRDAQILAALRLEWNHLLARSSADTIFLTWEWISSWWECYAAPSDTLHIILVRDGAGVLVGILPFYRRIQPWLPSKPVKILRFIGDASSDSDYLDLILLRGREQEVLACVWEWLCSKRTSWDVLQLTGIPETSPTCAWLKQNEARGETLNRSEYFPCLVTDLPETWDDYLTSLKPRFRTKIRSTLREINAKYEVRFGTVDAAVDLGARLQDLYDLHAKRWNTRGTDGVFVNPAKRKFYERFTRLFFEQRWLAFDLLELNGRTAACQMCFRYGDTQFLLQEGFDPEFASESVGIVLRAMVLKNAIEQGVRHYDFLAGLGRHKTQWQTREKRCESILTGPRTLQNFAYVRLPKFMESCRERMKMMIPAKVLELRGRVLASSAFHRLPRTTGS